MPISPATKKKRPHTLWLNRHMDYFPDESWIRQNQNHSSSSLLQFSLFSSTHSRRMSSNNNPFFFHREFSLILAAHFPCLRCPSVSCPAPLGVFDTVTLIILGTSQALNSCIFRIDVHCTTLAYTLLPSNSLKLHYGWLLVTGSSSPDDPWLSLTEPSDSLELSSFPI